MRILLASFAAALLLAGASPALAATVVTSRNDGDPVSGGPFASFHVNGTATIEPSVDLVCAHKNGGTWHYTHLTGGQGVPVVAGVWSVEGVQVSTSIGACRLLALPAGDPTPAAGTDPQTLGYAGPRLRPLVAAPLTLPNAGNDQYDVQASVGGLTSTSFLTSIGDSGLSSTRLLTGDPADDTQVFGGANAIRPFDPLHPQGATGNVFGLQVDGKDAYTGPMWHDAGGNCIAFFGYVHVPTVAVTRSVAGDGSLVLTEHDTLAVCPANDSAYPLGGFSCSSNTGTLTDPGITIDVTTTASPTGEVIRRDWTISSTDAAPHTVRLVLGHDIIGLGRQWHVPGTAGYAPRLTGEDVTSALPATGPFSLAVSQIGSGDPDPAHGLGLLTFSTVPSSLRFASTRKVDATYNLTVPAGGQRRLAFVFATAENQGAIDADQAAAEAGVTPAVAIAAPLAGASVAADHITVRGTATDSAGIGTLTVNGAVVPVAGDGTWSADVPLVVGDNPISAVLTNVLGATANAQRTVTRVVPPDPGSNPGSNPGSDPGSNPGSDPPPVLTAPGTGPAAPVLTGRGKAKLTKRVLALGYAVSCPGAGPACTVTLTLAPKKGKRLGRATLQVPAGKTVALKVKVKQAGKALQKAKPKLSVAVTRGTLTPVTLKKALRL